MRTGHVMQGSKKLRGWRHSRDRCTSVLTAEKFEIGASGVDRSALRPVSSARATVFIWSVKYSWKNVCSLFSPVADVCVNCQRWHRPKEQIAIDFPDVVVLIEKTRRKINADRCR
jgi:hypothetical protein